MLLALFLFPLSSNHFLCFFRVILHLHLIIPVCPYAIFFCCIPNTDFILVHVVAFTQPMSETSLSSSQQDTNVNNIYFLSFTHPRTTSKLLVFLICYSGQKPSNHCDLKTEAIEAGQESAAELENSMYIFFTSSYSLFGLHLMVANICPINLFFFCVLMTLPSYDIYLR